MEFGKPLGSAAQAAYAELLEVTRHVELSRSVENLSGSFNRKVVKGITYWYYQFTDAGGGRTNQIFVGRDSDKIRALVERSRTADDGRLDAMAKAAISLGCASATPAHFRIVRRLNETGFFRAGGVLVGTHAFLAMGNALGMSWGDIARTQYLDFAHAGKQIELAVPSDLRIQTGSALESLEAGFLPVPGFRPWDKTASFVSKVDRQLRVDFLTPMTGGKGEPFRHEPLGVHLQPLRFLEFLLEGIDQSVVISALGTVLVNIPDPARYALHKMLVYAERRARNPQKALKDLRQSAALIETLAPYRSDDLMKLWKSLIARGPGWRQRARKAIPPLREMMPHLDIVASMSTTLATFTRGESGKQSRAAQKTGKPRSRS